MSDALPPDPVARLEASLDSIKGEGAWLNAVVALDEAGARAAALASQARLAAGRPLSALDGRTVIVKANCAVEGLPWTAALKPLADDVARSDSTVVARLRAAGAIIVGLANMHEAALGATTDSLLYGKAYNPLGRGLTPGGSSGGSAAAVAAGLVDLAVGTDTMGSVRIPSAYCGVVGFKPTRGRVSTDGVIPLSTTLDCVGFHAPSVAGIKAMLDACENPQFPEVDYQGNGQANWLELGVPLDPVVFDLLQPVRQSRNWPRWDFPSNWDKLRRAGLLVCETELLESLGHRFGDFSGLTPALAAMLAWAREQPVEKVEAARAYMLSSLSGLDEAFFDTDDFLVLPTASHQAFDHDSPAPLDQADLTVLASVAGWPAISLPVWPAGPGLPAGLQILTAPGQDHALLEFAARLEADLPKRIG
jgi:aspartyl-tRNA(Asn)/glutamyl-tRNA(Gln) amidotransferase subunit A